MLLFCSIVVLSVSGCINRQPEPVARHGWITDYANIMSQSEKTRISATLAAYEKDTCHQIFVLIVPSLKGEELENFSFRTAIAWEIGQPGFGNGILLTIAMQEGSMRLETASAFDWFVDQGISERVLKEVMVPYFKERKYVEGIGGRSLRVKRIPGICSIGQQTGRSPGSAYPGGSSELPGLFN